METFGQAHHVRADLGIALAALHFHVGRPLAVSADREDDEGEQPSSYGNLGAALQALLRHGGAPFRLWMSRPRAWGVV